MWDSPEENKKKEEEKTLNHDHLFSFSSQKGKAAVEVLPQEEISFSEKPVEGLKKGIKFLLFAVTALLPVWFLPFTAPVDILVNAKQLLVYGAALMGGILWIVIAARQGGIKLKLIGWEGGVLAVLAAGLLSALFSAQGYNSFLGSSGFLILASLILLFFLIVNFFEKKDLPALLNWFILGATFALAAAIPFLNRLFFPKIGLPINTVGSFNDLGALAALILVLIISRHFGFPQAVEVEVSSWKKWFWRAVQVVGATSAIWWLIGLNWWVFYLVVAMGMIGIVWGLTRLPSFVGQTAKLETSRLVVPMAILVLALVLLVFSRYFNFGFSRWLLPSNLPVEVSLSQNASWSIAKEAVQAKPFWGEGLENFGLAFDRFKPASLNQSVFWNFRFNQSASEFFNLLVEQGTVGLAALLFLLFFVLRSVFYWNRDTTESQWLVWPFFLAFLTLFILYPFNIVLLTTFWLMLGWLAVAVFREHELKIRMDSAAWPSLVASLVFVLVLVIGAVGGYFYLQRYLASIYFAHASRIAGNKAEDFDREAALVSKAAALNSGEDVYWTNLAELSLRRLDLELGNKESKPEDIRQRAESLIRQVAQAVSQVTTRHPDSAANWFNAGLAYERLTPVLGGAEEAAVSAYREYLKKAPGDPLGYVRLGGAYLNQADRLSVLLQRKDKSLEGKEQDVTNQIDKSYQTAEENFHRAVELKADLATAIYNLGIVYERQGRLKEAIKQLELTRNTNRQNASLAFELGLLYYRDNNKTKATEEMKRAVALFKDFANARWYLALMLEEKGEKEGAIEQLKEILSMEANKDNAAVQQKIAALQAGKREIPPTPVTSKKPLEFRELLKK